MSAHPHNAHLSTPAPPNPDSVIRVGGGRGTVYQRFISDGLWHGTNGQVRAWEDLISKPAPVEVIIAAPPRLEVGAVYMNAVGDIFVIKDDGSHEVIRHHSPQTVAAAWDIAHKVYSPADGLIG